MKFFPLTILIIIFLFYAHIVSGAPCGPSPDGKSYTLCESIPGIDPTQKDFAGFFAQLYRFALMLGGTVIFIQIVRGGILYAWSGVVNKKQEAIEIFKGVAQGSALLMGSYLILNTINPALTVITVPEINTYAPKAQYTTQNRRNLSNAQIQEASIQQNEAFSEATKERILNLEAAISRGQGGPGAHAQLDALYKNYADKQAEIVRLKQQQK